MYLPDPGIKSGFPALQVDSLPTELSGKPHNHYRKLSNHKGKWLPEEALQIAVKRRAAKSKGEKERYTHLNAEFQRIARRDKKAFLSDQCKDIEKNNSMVKTFSLQEI